MARAIPGGIDLTSDTTLVMCIQITDRLGVVTGYTEHDQTLSINLSDGNGAVSYEPNAAFARSAFEARSAGRVGSSDFIGFMDSGGVTESALFAGFYDSALVKVFLVDWTQPGAGVIHIEIGELEETHVEEDGLTVTMKSLLDRYNSIQIGEVYSAECIHLLGSLPADIPPPFAKTGCQIQLNPPTWTAGIAAIPRADTNGKATGYETSGSPTQFNTVQPTTENGRFFEVQTGGTTGGSEPSWDTTLGATTNDNGVVWVARQALRETVTILSATDQKTLVVDYDGDAEDNWYRRGILTFATGANAGVSRHIKTQVVSGSPDQQTITCWLDFPLAIAAGDTATITAGCDKQLVTCLGKFRNVKNYGGFAIFAPNTDEAFKIPKQTV